jgi:hypothetical protein
MLLLKAVYTGFLVTHCQSFSSSNHEFMKESMETGLEWKAWNKQYIETKYTSFTINLLTQSSTTFQEDLRQ